MIVEKFSKFLLEMSREFSIASRSDIPKIQNLSHLVMFIQNVKKASSFYVDMMRQTTEDTLVDFIYDSTKFLMDSIY
jgi:hypothetical protein